MYTWFYASYLLISEYTNQNTALSVVGLADTGAQLYSVLRAFFLWGTEVQHHLSHAESDQDTLTFFCISPEQAAQVRESWRALPKNSEIVSFFKDV